MRLSSFPALGLEGLLAAETPPVWALSVLEDTMDIVRKDGDVSMLARIEKEIVRIERDLASRYAT